MFSLIRRHLSAGTVLGTLALIFAMTGAAWAAHHYLISSTKQISPKVLAQLKGNRGPRGARGATGARGAQGPRGAQGAQGPTGPKGVTGTNGTDGTNGNTVLSGSGAPASSLGSNGDFYIDTDFYDLYGPKTSGGWGSPTSLKGPKGDAGSPWTAGGTLPSGATETGTWGAVVAPSGFAMASISFPIPLAASLDSAHVHLYSDTASSPGGAFSATCTGTAANPTAPSGNLCIYQGTAINMPSSQVGNPADNLSPDASVAGTVVDVQNSSSSSPSSDNGTWAVTG
jgi:hypothetical protein